MNVTKPEAAASAAPGLTPLQNEARATLPTREAAAHLNRAQQTLRLWAAYENGPLKPLRLHGRLMWPTAEIKRLLGLEVA